MEELAAFIKREEPSIKGFSARNIWTMKQFYETYQGSEKLPSLMAELSWTQNRRIMSLKTAEEREFYLLLCQQQNYSVRELERLINSGTFERTMLADQNVSEAIKQLPQSTQGVFKDRYIFEFLDLPSPHHEKELQHALISSLKDFILELGIGQLSLQYCSLKHAQSRRFNAEALSIPKEAKYSPSSFHNNTLV